MVFNRIQPQKTETDGALPDTAARSVKLPMPDPVASTQSKNVLSSDVEIKGLIKFKTDLFIDGKVEGEIISPGVLTIGEHAEIHGDIRTKSVTIYGSVHANVVADERCELKGNAQLIGDLKSARLGIEEGTTFIGKSDVNPNHIAMKSPEVVRLPDGQKPGAVIAGR